MGASPPWPFVFLFHGQLCLTISWDYSYTPVCVLGQVQGGRGGRSGTREAGEGRAGRSVSVPTGLENSSGSIFSFLLPQACGLAKAEKAQRPLVDPPPPDARHCVNCPIHIT